MKIANTYKISIVPRGTGSGLSGGSIPIKGGVVLHTVDMNRILDVDKENLTILVEPGVITSESMMLFHRLDFFILRIRQV